MNNTSFLACCGALSIAVVAASPARAQIAPVVPYNAGDALRQSEEAERAAPRQPASAPVLPQLVEPPFTMKSNETLLVHHFRIEGAGPIDEAEIQAILVPYENRKLTLTQIYEAADKISTLYRDRGYLVAKAYVPAQDARKGTLRIKIVPGKYGAISVKNESLVRTDYVQGVIDHALNGAELIHRKELERAMLLISDLAGAGMPHIAIGAGQRPETSDFVFGVPPGQRVDGYLLYDNFGSPLTGRNRMTGGFDFNSPLGFGDKFTAFGMVSDEAGLVNGRAAYSFPIGYSGLRAEFAGFHTTYVLGEQYKVLDATGTADGASATLTYPVLLGQDQRLYVSGNYTWKDLDDKVFGLSLSHRTIELGTVAVTHNMNTALFGLPLQSSATFSYTYGQVDFPDPAQRAADLATTGISGDYQRINLLFNATLDLPQRWSFLTTLRAQKSLTGSLDTSEELGLTGFWGVKSFDEGLAGDSGYVVTPELRYALPDIRGYRHSIGAFTDVGAMWLENPIPILQKGYTQINDVGIGYYAGYDYQPGRSFLLKAFVAWTYGSDGGAESYNKGTKALVQAGFTF
jgi:hemolysin activation/secretion protein